jgi:hypothetical protein
MMQVYPGKKIQQKYNKRDKHTLIFENSDKGVSYIALLMNGISLS